MIKSKPIEIFCGTGGVGKTTLATSRAVFLALQGKKVLLITIDPAKRLKQVLKQDQGEAGEIHTVCVDVFGFDGGQTLDALWPNPAVTLKKMGTSSELEGSHIIQTLTRPYGGMNEIMSLIEVEHHFRQQNYDTIVLDTPPGKHFIDFLRAAEKINSFFDSSFIELFKLVAKPSSKKGLISQFVSSGIKKLLHHLEKVTGPNFVEEFVITVMELYNNKDLFLRALQLEGKLKLQEFSNWFLVTSVEQQKADSAHELRTKASQLMHSDNYLLLNKCTHQYLENWKTNGHNALEKLKSSMLNKENELKKLAKEGFLETVEFPEITASSPQEHVKQLVSFWP